MLSNEDKKERIQKVRQKLGVSEIEAYQALIQCYWNVAEACDFIMRKSSMRKGI